MTAREHRQPELSQIVQIRKLATVVIGEGGADQLFAEVGYPESYEEAAAYIGALHKIRNQRRGPSDYDERRGLLVDSIKAGRAPATPTLTVAPEPEEEELMPEDTKECTGCGKTKPLTDFHKRRSSTDGHALYCKPCVKEKYGTKPANQAPKQRSKKTRKKTKKTSSSPTKAPTGAGGEDSAPADPPLPSPVVTPPLSAPSNGDWRELFRDPRLSHLQELQAILGGSYSLEDTAEISQAIAALEWS